MVGRRVVVLCNLKPAKMRGIVSEGMVMAASNADHTAVQPLIPPVDAPIGARVGFMGHDGEADKVLNPKKKVWEKLQADMATDEQGVATWRGVPMSTAEGVVTASEIPNGTVG